MGLALDWASQWRASGESVVRMMRRGAASSRIVSKVWRRAAWSREWSVAASSRAANWTCGVEPSVKMETSAAGAIEVMSERIRSKNITRRGRYDMNLQGQWGYW